MQRVRCQYLVFCLQAWADAFRSSPDLTGVVQIYEELKRKGVEFPMADLDALSPIHTPQRVWRPCHSTYSTVCLFFFFLSSYESTCCVVYSYAYCFSAYTRNLMSTSRTRTDPSLFIVFYSLPLWINQGVPEVDPASHKYKAPPQPKPASQTPQTSAASVLPAQTQMPNIAGPITPTPEQVSVTIKHRVVHC